MKKGLNTWKLSLRLVEENGCKVQTKRYKKCSELWITELIKYVVNRWCLDLNGSTFLIYWNNTIISLMCLCSLFYSFSPDLLGPPLTFHSASPVTICDHKCLWTITPANHHLTSFISLDSVHNLCETLIWLLCWVLSCFDSRLLNLVTLLCSVSARS